MILCRKLFQFIVVLLIAVACNDETDSPTTTLLTVDGSTIVTSVDAENWFVAWDSKGNLLDHKKYINGETITLSTAKVIAGTTITLAILSYTATDIESYSEIIYADVDPGMTYKAIPNESSGLVPQDKFRVTINPLPYEYSSMYASSKFGMTSVSYGSPILDASVDPNTDKYVVMYRNGTQVRYKPLSNVKKDDNFLFTPDDFLWYEKSFDINFPTEFGAADVEVRGFEPGVSFTQNGYLLDRFFPEQGVSPVQSGFFQGIANVKTTVNLNINGKLVEFMKFGKSPGTISWPDVTKFQGFSGGPKNFKASVSTPFNFLQASWIRIMDDGSHRTTTIYSTKVDPIIGEIPADIATDHPTFVDDTGSTAFSATWFFIGPQTYNEYLTDVFSTFYDSEREQLSVRVYSN